MREAHEKKKDYLKWREAREKKKDYLKRREAREKKERLSKTAFAEERARARARRFAKIRKIALPCNTRAGQFHDPAPAARGDIYIVMRVRMCYGNYRHSNAFKKSAPQAKKHSYYSGMHVMVFFWGGPGTRQKTQIG